MEFGIEKCVMLIMRSREKEIPEGIAQERIRTFGEKETYKYLGMLEIHTPIYELTKTIKQLITPYLSSKYNIKSTDELIQVLHTLKPNNGILASMDVENLFTNVPVSETIDIIINNIYNNPSPSSLKINPNIL